MVLDTYLRNLDTTIILVSFSKAVLGAWKPDYHCISVDILNDSRSLHTLICIGVPHGASKGSVSPMIISGKVHLPFQLQIKYTDEDGSRCMRVSTFAKPVTSNKETVERGEIYIYYALQE